jgi:hypothetical protein
VGGTRIVQAWGRNTCLIRAGFRYVEVHIFPTPPKYPNDKTPFGCAFKGGKILTSVLVAPFCSIQRILPLKK